MATAVQTLVADGVVLTGWRGRFVHVLRSRPPVLPALLSFRGQRHVGVAHGTSPGDGQRPGLRKGSCFSRWIPHRPWLRQKHGAAQREK